MSTSAKKKNPLSHFLSLVEKAIKKTNLVNDLKDDKLEEKEEEEKEEEKLTLDEKLKLLKVWLTTWAQSNKKNKDNDDFFNLLRGKLFEYYMVEMLNKKLKKKFRLINVERRQIYPRK